jgi:hypothetical protein
MATGVNGGFEAALERLVAVDIQISFKLDGTAHASGPELSRNRSLAVLCPWYSSQAPPKFKGRIASIKNPVASFKDDNPYPQGNGTLYRIAPEWYFWAIGAIVGYAEYPHAIKIAPGYLPVRNPVQESTCATVPRQNSIGA